MKKIISVLILFCFAIITKAQYPITQNLGSDSTIITVGRNTMGAIKGGLIVMSFTDTTAANLTRIKLYGGAMIWTTSDSSLWVRNKQVGNTNNSGVQYWFKIGGAGGGSTGSFWNLTGNFMAAIPAGFGIGTNSTDNLPFKTDGTTRVILPSTGLARQSGGAWTTMMFDTTNKTWGYGNGYTPTLQQVMGTEGNYSVLTSTSDISPSSGSYDFFIGDDLRWRDIELRGDRKIELNNLISNLSIGDSIMINPYTGIINIDSLRTWSGISDTTYKKPMTWDTRNGRWEYAANWYGSGASTIPLSSITAATASNTINNGNYTQEWQWNTKDSYGLKLTANTTADGDNQALLSVQLSGNNATSNITSYGLTASNSHTGTNSTNIGGFSYAGGGTTNIGLRTVATGGTTNIALDLGQSGSYLGNMRMNGNTSGSITIQPAAAAGTYTLTLPTTDGASGEFLQTDGSGVLTWAAAGGGSAAGNFGNLQINRNGAFATPGSDSLDYENSTGLTVKNDINVSGTGKAFIGRWKARVDSTTSSATPTINTDNIDIYKITAQAADITSFTTNLSGTPYDGDILEIVITGTATRAITWGASFVSTTVTLPTTTSSTTTLTVILQYFKSSSYGNNKWHCVNYF